MTRRSKEALNQKYERCLIHLKNKALFSFCSVMLTNFCGIMLSYKKEKLDRKTFNIV